LLGKCPDDSSDAARVCGASRGAIQSAYGCRGARLTTWLHGVKALDLSCAPLVRAILDTSCGGIKLQIWRKMMNWDGVGLMLFFFIPALWQDQNIEPTLFCSNRGMAVIHNLFSRFLGERVLTLALP
jgi:hypothetical protein